MTNFMWLVFAHYIGDVALQSDWQSKNKGKYIYIMFCHCMIWTACICIAMSYAHISITMPKIVFLVSGHACADLIKTRFPKDKKHFWMIYPDQLFHLIQLGVVYAS